MCPVHHRATDDGRECVIGPVVLNEVILELLDEFLILDFDEVWVLGRGTPLVEDHKILVLVAEYALIFCA